MAHLPSLERFTALARDADYVPVYRELLSDALSPVQAFARLDRGEAAGLFESVIGGEKVGRYSFVASDPFLLLEARGTSVTIRRRNPPPSKGGARGGITERGRVSGLEQSAATVNSSPDPSLQGRGVHDANIAWETETLDVPNPLEILREQVQAVRVAHLPALPPLSCSITCAKRFTCSCSPTSAGPTATKSPVGTIPLVAASTATSTPCMRQPIRCG
jgi:hypothetical protein